MQLYAKSVGMVLVLWMTKHSKQHHHKNSINEEGQIQGKEAEVSSLQQKEPLNLLHNKANRADAGIL